MTALLLNSTLLVSPAWREGTGQSKQPLNGRVLGSDLRSGLEVFVKCYLLPWSIQELSAKRCCSNSTLVSMPSPFLGLLSGLGARLYAGSLQMIL